MKQILALLFACSAILQANGQVLKSIGLKGGVSVANQDWNYKSTTYTLNTENRNGFYSALTFEFLKSKYLSLSTDLGYCAKGSATEVMNTTNDLPEGDGTYETYDTKFDYFTLSPSIKLRYETTHLVPYALFGLRMDYQLSYKSDFDYQLIEKEFNKTIWGANFGAGLEYKFKQLGIFLEGQYQYDFTKVLDMPESASNSAVEVNNEAFVICVGLKYNLTKKEVTK